MIFESCDFVIAVINSNLDPYISPFLRYGQFSVEKRTFFLTRSLHLTTNLKMCLLHCIAQILQA